MEWTKLEVLTKYRSMHPQADVDRLYWKRAEGGKGLQSVEETASRRDKLGVLPKR